MRRDNWISRDSSGFHWRRKQKCRQTLILLLTLAGAVLVGWFSFDPIYMMVTGTALPNQVHRQNPAEEPQPEPELSVPEQTAEELPAEEQPEPEQTAEKGFPSRSLYLPESVLGSPERLAQVLESCREMGADGVVFDLKNSAGRVLYDSALAVCREDMSLSDAPYSLEAVCRQIEAAGLIPVGRLYAFRDSTSTKTMSAGAVKYMDSQINWIDNSLANGGKAWLNPCNGQSREYILSLVREAAARGISCLILDGVQFPEGYSLHLATYGVSGQPDRSAVLSSFLREAVQAAEPESCEIWPVINLMTASQASQIRCGEHPEQLLEAAGRGLVDLSLSQFGTGVRTERLTIQEPSSFPYESVRDALEASEEVLGDGQIQLAAMAQTSVQELEQLEEQLRAAKESGIEKVFLCAADGQYRPEMLEKS